MSELVDSPSMMSDMQTRVDAYDWHNNPLGPRSRWPSALRTLVGVMLGSRQPMFVAWGPERIMIYNDGYAPMLGNRHPGALGSPFAEVWFDILPDVGPIMDRAYAGVATHMDDIRFVMHRNGYPEETSFAFSYTPVRNEQGQVEGVFCACTETTDRLRAEARVHEKETELRQILDGATDFAIIALDREGRVTHWNAGARRILGWDETEMVGQTIHRCFTPDDVRAGRVERESRQARDTGSAGDEGWRVRKDGSRFWASGQMTTVRDAGGILTGFVKVLRDRTAQRMSDAALGLERGAAPHRPASGRRRHLRMGSGDRHGQHVGRVPAAMGSCRRGASPDGFGRSRRSGAIAPRWGRSVPSLWRMPSTTPNTGSRGPITAR